jgi:hypothetical protein
LPSRWASATTASSSAWLNCGDRDVEEGPGAQVPCGGDVGREQLAGAAQHQDQLLRVGFGFHPGHRARAAIEAQVHVGVDQPGQQRYVAQVHHVSGDRMPGQEGVKRPRRDDPGAVHQDATAVDELVTRAGQQRARLVKAHGYPL